MALISNASTGPLRPTASLHLYESNTNKVFYTIPDGKFFIGYIGHSASGSPIKVNDVDFFSHLNLNTSSNTGAMEVTLYAGDKLKSQSSGNFYVHGCLYDL